MRFVLGILLFVATLPESTGWAKPAHERQHKALSAPTYYIALWAQREDQDSVQFRGASNLPSGARIGVVVTAFSGAGWMDHSDNTCFSVGEDGLFGGRLSPRQGMKFRDGIGFVLRAYYETNLCQPQPANVLQILGEKGQGLANVKDGDITELAGLSDNPQIYQVSGWYYGLDSIARVEGVSSMSPPISRRSK